LAPFKAPAISPSSSNGEFVSIVGPNGAGKTTLVMWDRLSGRDAGEVRFLGRDISGIGPVETARLGMSRRLPAGNIFRADGARTLAVRSHPVLGASPSVRSLGSMTRCRLIRALSPEVLGLRARLETVAR